MCDDRVKYSYTDEDFTNDPSELQVIVTTSNNIALEIIAPDGVINSIWLDEVAINRLMRALRLASQEIFA